MKRVFRVLSLAFLMMTGINAAYASSLKVENLTWVDYMGSFDDSFNLTSGGSMNITRSYLTLKAQLSDTVFARVTYDFAKNNATTADGYFKLAYVDFKVADILNVLVGTQVEMIGQMWTYPLPVYPIAALTGVSHACDMGVGIKATLMDGKLVPMIQIVNGEGYQKWTSADLDQNYAMLASLTVNYSDSGKAGLTFRLDEADVARDWAGDVYIQQSLGDLTVIGEYIVESTTNALVHNASATLSYGLNDRMDMNARYDLNDGANKVYVSPTFNFADGSVKVKPLFAVGLNATTDFTLGVRTDISFGYTVFSDAE